MAKTFRNWVVSVFDARNEKSSTQEYVTSLTYIVYFNMVLWCHLVNEEEIDGKIRWQLNTG